MNYFELSRRHQAPPLGYSSWRAYWIEMAVFCTAFAVGMACVAVATLMGGAAV
jgi:hypothetical protein